MTGKYESLLPEILPEPSLGNGRYVAGIRDALNWLDDHPEQVPRPRMTYSELAEEVKSVERVEKRFEAVAYVLTNLGFTICSDPEPPMTAVKAWIEERREVQRAARGESEFDQTLDSVRMFPRALDALNKVLELHKPVKHREWMGPVWRDQTGSDWREKTACEECTRLVNKYVEWDHEKTYIEYPCPAVQAIAGEINE